ncbi:hypothetical protein JOB18_007244 [Solea senegalensis]|uniref:Uncharacterized protein n=1 Tax=Solea senegalensis TaxID=28829 RepID=A0AAV6T4R5_SOLSE|nr:hypothetical protein JOB18_007244 [Solea senegalensis]
MSTSDAGAAELQQLRTAPPAHRTPRAARTATARSQHDETVDERDQPENPNSDATPSGQVRHRSTIRKKGPHRVIIFGADGIRRQEAAKACGPRFTTSLFFKLSKNQKVGVKLQPESDCCHSSLPDPQTVDTEDTCHQVNQGASPPETPAGTASDLLLKIVTRTEEVITTGCNEPETTRDVNTNHPLSNGDSGPHDYHSLHILPHVTHPKSTCSGLEEIKKDIKVHTQVEDQNNLGLSNAAVTMLSSTMVTVLAPHWTGRIRRTKRFEGIGDSEALGNFQVMASTATNHAPSQHGVERAVTERSQARQRDPFLVTRSNTVEWSTKSDLARLDYESKRKINQPVSLDVNSERMDNRKLDKGALSPVAPNVSSMSLDPNEQRRNPQTGNQGVHSALSSKPTTSSLLLSLRRMNSSGMSSTAASGLSDENHTARDQQGNMHTPHLSQSILNNNEKDRTKSVLSPQLTSYRTAETGPIPPPSSSNRREGNMSESRFFSNSPTNKDTEVTPFTQQPQTCSKPVFLSRGESVMQQNCRDSNKNTNIYPSVSSPRHSPYDTSALLKNQTLPRRTTLTSTSWWKQVTQEGSSPVTHNVTPSINDQLNTPLFSPCNDRSNLAMPVPSDNNRLRSQISLNRDNNNTADTVFIVESNNEQSPKRSRFALKKSVSTPSFSLSRSDSERSNKTNNKMDQVLNKLRQTFSTRRSEDDPSFPWKWKRALQTPSVSGLSDISSVSDATVDHTKTLEEGGSMLKDSVKGTEDTNRWTQNRYTIIPPPAVTGDGFSAWSEKSPPETGQDEKSACEGQALQSATQVHLTAHSPTIHQLDFFKDNKTDYKPTSQSPTCRDPSPNLNPNQSDGYATQFRKSTSSPRSPFSPFSSLTPVSLTPVSPFSSPDATDDSVFYSPKLQRRRESPSCDAGEGISLGSSRSRASTGPPSPDIGQDREHLASSYADLKYGIVPGRSFSVSSVLSSRPSGPGRISTGSRFMSVGDLSRPSSTCSGNGKDLDRWSFPAGLPPSEYGVSYYSGDPGKMRSRSLPRSFTSCLTNWSSGVNNSPPRVATASKPAHLWGANVNICDFEWDVEGPPTPPPTPPLSPVSRRISTPPSISSPTFPSPPGAPQSVESQSSRGRLPSRGYVSSLSTFEESSDSSSDTTTDDEYYLETGDGEEKETEL